MKPWQSLGMTNSTFGSERLTHHVHILEINGNSYRLAQSRARKSADTA
ncbi:hypothetical protein DT23_18735 [Thioclava indica]|uniref:Uncharacterized protein n=1 Tax=Thioclava indica TaxID=1353528 RepID=A0A074J914_9RHOB|nr:hypothetical protein DT23_18735 [Thioclava indica]